MNYLSPALSLAALFAPLDQAPQPPAYLPSGIEHVTTADFVPQVLSPSQVDLRRVRFTGPAENDLAVLRAGELGLLLRPGRLECFYQLRSDVAAIAVVALDAAPQEHLLVASPDGLEVMGCDPGELNLHSSNTTHLIPNTDIWSQTRGIWVHENSNGTIDAYGARDGSLLHVHYDGNNWTDMGETPGFDELQEIAWFDYDDSGVDDIAWRFSNAIGIQNGSTGQVLVTYAANPTDRISALIEPGTHDRLAWSTQWPAGTSVLAMIELSSLTGWVPIQGGLPVALVPIHYSDGPTSANGQEVMAVSGTDPYGFVQKSTGGGAPMDPHPTWDGAPGANLADLRDDASSTGAGTGTGNVAAAAGDFDGDGRDDLAFMRDDGQLRFWLGHQDRYMHSYVSSLDHGTPLPYLDLVTGHLKMDLGLRRRPLVAVGGEAHIRVWFRDMGQNQSADFIGDYIISEQPDLSPGADPDDVLFGIDFGSVAYTPGESIRVSVTPRHLDSSGNLVGYGVTRQLLWVPNSGGQEGMPELALEPAFFHGTTSGGSGGDATGTRTGGGQNNPPSSPPPGG